MQVDEIDLLTQLKLQTFQDLQHQHLMEKIYLFHYHKEKILEM